MEWDFSFKIIAQRSTWNAACLLGDIKMLMKKIVFGLVVMFLASATTLMAQDADDAVKKEKSPTKKATAKLMKSF